MKLNVKKYLGESFLIVFSVLFALLINNAFQNYKTYQKKAIARESIMKELTRNEAILKDWKQRHIDIREKLIGMGEGRNDSLKTELAKYDYLNLGVLTDNENLIDAILINTAWETARTTGIITEFDYETIQKLTHVYAMQEVLTEKTIANITEYYFDTDADDLANLDNVLTQFQLRFWELTGQEELLTGLYREAVEHLRHLD